MLATLLVPWPRPRLSSDRGAIASPSSCCLLISNASCGLGGFGCAAHTVRKMSLRSPQSRRTYAGLRSWSLDRHQRPIHVLRSRCHGSVPFDPASPLGKERMVRAVPRDRAGSLAATIADFCNKICHLLPGADAANYPMKPGNGRSEGCGRKAPRGDTLHDAPLEMPDRSRGGRRPFKSARRGCYRRFVCCPATNPHRCSVAFSPGSGTRLSSAFFTNSTESIAAPSWVRNCSIASFIGGGSDSLLLIDLIIAV